MKNNIEIHYLEKGDPEVCELILHSLPDWFGIEESTLAYINKSQDLPMITAVDEGRTIGFLSLKHHSQFTAEIYVMAVYPRYHRKGIGQMLLNQAEKILTRGATEFIQVKTLAPSMKNEFYAKTRLFYKSLGFKELEVFPTLWGEKTPCQLLIKSISQPTSNSSFSLIQNRKLDMSFLKSSLTENEMMFVNPSANFPFEEDYWRKFYELEDCESVSLLYYEQEKVIGHVTLQQNFAQKGIVHLCFFYLSKEYRGTGVTEHFLRDIEIYLKLNFQVDRYYLNVRYTNKRAINFYKKAGFLKFRENDHSMKMVKVL